MVGRRLAAVGVLACTVLWTACGEETPTEPASVPSPLVDHDTPVPGEVILCKYAPVSTTADFRVSATGGRVPGNGRFTLNAVPELDVGPECEVVWNSNGQSADVTIEEDVSEGLQLVAQVVQMTGGSAQFVEPPQNPLTISVDANTGAIVWFKNILTEGMNPGRMTGGGGQIRFDDIYITRGFTIHCDITLSNNVNVNWPDNHWHIDKPLTSAECIDDPAVEPAPPPAPFDTFIGEGIGSLNGVDGSFIRFVFVDGGEPSGGGDRASISIWAPGDDPDTDTPVLLLPMTPLDNGNIQAHYDQPHGSKANN